MLVTPDILVSDFNYDLPDKKIAKFPLPERNSSKLLIYKNGKISEDKFNQLSNYIPENNLLVFNDTKVIHARLEFQKKTGARIEIFCLEPHEPADYVIAFAQNSKCQWKCLVGNLKKWKNDSLIKLLNFNNKEIVLQAKLLYSEIDYQVIEFEWSSELSFAEIIEVFGEVPIPPYLNRKPVESDNERYQTIYSRINGSVAAPTAGLHFTCNEFKKLSEKGIKSEYLTLHVGAGTFRPLKSKTLGTHQMHAEYFQVSLNLIKNLIFYYPNIIAVGTTSVRAIESLYIIGNLIENNKNINYFTVNQWDAYGIKFNQEPLFALKKVENYLKKNGFKQLNASTSMMLVPGYKYKIISGLLTNFHQPKSTLLVLVASFIGEKWKEIYSFALNNNFRFLSYGDSSLLFY